MSIAISIGLSDPVRTISSIHCEREIVPIRESGKESIAIWKPLQETGDDTCSIDSMLVLPLGGGNELLTLRNYNINHDNIPQHNASFISVHCSATVNFWLLIQISIESLVIMQTAVISCTEDQSQYEYPLELDWLYSQSIIDWACRSVVKIHMLSNVKLQKFKLFLSIDASFRWVSPSNSFRIVLPFLLLIASSVGIYASSDSIAHRLILN